MGFCIKFNESEAFVNKENSPMINVYIYNTVTKVIIISNTVFSFSNTHDWHL